MKYIYSFQFINLLLVNVMCNFVVVVVAVVTALNGSGNGLRFLEQILLGVK